MKVPKELDEHLALAKWLNLSGIFFIHVPNEGERSIQQRELLGRMGLRKGAPDFLIFGGTENVAIEMKRVKGSRVSPEQIAFLETLEELGWKTKISYGAVDAIGFLTTLSLKKKPLKTVHHSNLPHSLSAKLSSLKNSVKTSTRRGQRKK